MDTISAAPNNRSNTIYIVLTVILVILSTVGIVLLFQIIKTKNTLQKANQTAQVSEVTPAATVTPTAPAEDITPTASVVPTSSASAKLTPILSPKTSPTVTPKATSSGTPTSETKAKTLNFESKQDGFTATYNSARKLYQDTEASGNRYTFYSTTGNIAVHVGLNDKWSWTNPSRDFTNDFMVAGMPTFKYSVTNQSIVDFQFNNKNYTIQCVHNGKADLITECDEFLKNFKLTK